jgi:hypothetical protein
VELADKLGLQLRARRRSAEHPRLPTLPVGHPNPEPRANRLHLDDRASQPGMLG